MVLANMKTRKSSSCADCKQLNGFKVHLLVFSSGSIIFACLLAISPGFEVCGQQERDCNDAPKQQATNVGWWRRRPDDVSGKVSRRVSELFNLLLLFPESSLLAFCERRVVSGQCNAEGSNRGTSSSSSSSTSQTGKEAEKRRD